MKLVIDDSDDDLLQRELNYRAPVRDRRFFKTNPPGYNLLIGLGAVFALGGFVLGAGMTAVLFGTGGQGVPALMASGVGLVVALVLGLTLPPKVWVAIGPTGRSILRPIGYLGAWPVLVAALLGLSLVAGTIQAIQSGVPMSKLVSGVRADLSEGPVRGDDWQVLSQLQDGKQVPLKMTLAEARTACAALGKEWRLPGSQDVDFIRERLQGYRWSRYQFHVEADPNSKDGKRSLHLDKSKNGWRVVMDNVSVRPMGEVSHEKPVVRSVLCLRR